MPTAALKPLLRIDAEIAAMTHTGMTPAGHVALVPITRGSFEAEDVRGELLGGGADWQHLRSDGAVEISARYLLRSEQGEVIEVRSDGVCAPTPEVRERKARGETTSIHDYYWRTSLRFRTAAERLLRWNDVLAVAYLSLRKSGSAVSVHLDVFEVL
ncbi:MAG TPA: DUF3237 domain-containing protein [Polyangiales bacterium]|nr:DUF3237 domain-containing protein [Polyangiales bacterium]